MTQCVVAVDVGGTSIKAALVDVDGHVLREVVEATPVEQGPAVVIEQLRTITSKLATEPGVVAVGVVVPGAVDPTAGMATFAANLGWRDVPLRSLIAADTGLPVVLDHDVRAAGVAEHRLGNTRGEASSLLVVIGTGVAAVIRVDGRMLTGATGVPGELGHISIDPQGEQCPCGQRGCLERYASAAGISRRYAALSGAVGLSAEEICRRRVSDPAAKTAWDEAVAALASGLATATMLLDPAVIVVAGGLSEAGPALLDPLRVALSERLTWRPAPPVQQSSFGARAGLLGASVLAWNQVSAR